MPVSLPCWQNGNGGRWNPIICSSLSCISKQRLLCRNTQQAVYSILCYKAVVCSGQIGLLRSEVFGGVLGGGAQWGRLECFMTVSLQFRIIYPLIVSCNLSTSLVHKCVNSSHS